MSLLDITLAALDKYFDSNPGYPGLEAIRAKNRGMIRAYVEHYEEADRNQFQTIAVEELLTAPIVNPSTLKETGYIASGKIDVIATDKERRQRVIIDHKFLASAMDEDHHEHLMIDTQPLQYALLLHMNGEPVEAAVWDVVAKSFLRLRRGDTIQDYEDRIYEQFKKSPREFLNRLRIPINQYLLAEYASDLYTWTQYLHSSRMSNQHPKTPESCFNYHRACRYLSICSGRVDMLRGLERGDLIKIDNVHAELNLPEGIDPRMVVTNSRLKTFRACMYKEDLQYGLGIRKANEVTEEPLYVGSAAHAALEAYWEHLNDHNAN